MPGIPSKDCNLRELAGPDDGVWMIHKCGGCNGSQRDGDEYLKSLDTGGPIPATTTLAYVRVTRNQGWFSAFWEVPHSETYSFHKYHSLGKKHCVNTYIYTYETPSVCFSVYASIIIVSMDNKWIFPRWGVQNSQWRAKPCFRLPLAISWVNI